jgi:hypothetical protein
MGNDYVIVVLVNDQLDAQFFFYMFISILNMFRATSCSSSGAGREGTPSRPSYETVTYTE